MGKGNEEEKTNIIDRQKKRFKNLKKQSKNKKNNEIVCKTRKMKEKK